MLESVQLTYYGSLHVAKKHRENCFSTQPLICATGLCCSPSKNKRKKDVKRTDCGSLSITQIAVVEYDHKKGELFL